LLIAFKPGNRYDPWKMKTTFPRLFLVLVLLASATSLFADDFKSKVIAGNGWKNIHVRADQFLVIRNFTQELSATTTKRGVVTVSIDGENANVLTAAILDMNSSAPAEIINSVVIAGRAEVTVTCGDGTGNCFVTYKKDDNN
jgi:hypothetical protein